MGEYSIVGRPVPRGLCVKRISCFILGVPLDIYRGRVTVSLLRPYGDFSAVHQAGCTLGDNFLSIWITYSLLSSHHTELWALRQSSSRIPSAASQPATQPPGYTLHARQPGLGRKLRRPIYGRQQLFPAIPAVSRVGWFCPPSTRTAFLVITGLRGIFCCLCIAFPLGVGRFEASGGGTDLPWSEPDPALHFGFIVAVTDASRQEIRLFFTFT